MKANRSRFSKVMAQYEILKMKAAYILAEDQLTYEASTNSDEFNEYTSIDFASSHTPLPDYQYDSKHAKKNVLLRQMKQLIATGEKLLEQEKYLLLQEAKELYIKIKQEYDKL